MQIGCEASPRSAAGAHARGRAARAATRCRFDQSFAPMVVG